MTYRRGEQRKRALRKRDGDQCHFSGMYSFCPKVLDFTITDDTSDWFVTIEHKRRVADGGTDRLENMALAHRACNEYKGQLDELSRRNRVNGNYSNVIPRSVANKMYKIEGIYKSYSPQKPDEVTEGSWRDKLAQLLPDPSES